MSVDVFGRSLKKRKEATQGPPGNGYKLTSNGQFDAEGKKLCNLADPLEPNDAVNLQTLKNFITSEVQNLYEITKRLRSDLDNLSTIINTLKSEVEKTFIKLNF